MNLVPLKKLYLQRLREGIAEPLEALSRAGLPPQQKARQVNALVSQSHDILRDDLLASAEPAREMQRRLLVLRYCQAVVGLESRHSVWAYDYMAFSRRVGELWERFCSAAWDVPCLEGVQRIAAPSFADIEASLRHVIPTRMLDAEAHRAVHETLDLLFELVGEVNLRQDEVFEHRGRPHVIDLKSSFGSNEKGNTARLLAVGRAWRLWNPATRLLILVREDSDHHYLELLRRSELWEVRCADAAYAEIDALTGSDIGEIRREVIDFEGDCAPAFLHEIGALPGNLRSYLRW